VSSRWVKRGIHAVTTVVMVTALGSALFCLAASIGLQVSTADKIVPWICLALPWLMLFGAVWGIWKHLSYLISVPLLGLSVAFLGYLALDDSKRPPAPVIGAIVPADSKSYATYQRFLKGHPYNRSIEATKPIALPLFPSDIKEWTSFAVQNRALLEAAWLEDALGQEWIDEMAANKPEGLYPPPSMKDPCLDFLKIRRTSQLRWSKFHLCLIDGETDEAAQLLVSLVRASYNLQSAGTNLVSQMIPVVLLKGTYQRLELIADVPSLSSQTRKDILAALTEAPSIKLAFTNAFLGEQIIARESMDSMRGNPQSAFDELVNMAQVFDDKRDVQLFQKNVFRHFLFNPNRTEREYADYLTESCELLQNKHWDRSEKIAAAFEAKVTSWQLKNPVGRLFGAMALPAFQKIAKNFWQAEDQRVALINRLQQ
jgi:hypothetical protein